MSAWPAQAACKLWAGFTFITMATLCRPLSHMALTEPDRPSSPIYAADGIIDTSDAFTFLVTLHPNADPEHHSEPKPNLTKSACLTLVKSPWPCPRPPVETSTERPSTLTLTSTLNLTLTLTLKRQTRLLDFREEALAHLQAASRDQHRAIRVDVHRRRHGRRRRVEPGVDATQHHGVVTAFPRCSTPQVQGDERSRGSGVGLVGLQRTMQLCQGWFCRQTRALPMLMNILL